MIEQEIVVKEKNKLEYYTVKVTFHNQESGQDEEHWESALASDSDGALSAALGNYTTIIDNQMAKNVNAFVYEGRDNKGNTEAVATLHPKAA